MPFPLLLAALALGQEPAVAPAAPETTFQTPFVVAEPSRLAMSPILDGELGNEEWDPLFSSDSVKGYFQWEPGLLHVAATVPAGQDLLLSLDLRSNGWLVGADNLEVRISAGEGAPKIMGRLVDATNVAGPTWKELPGIGLDAKAVAKAGEAGMTYEVTLSDACLGLFPTNEGRGLSLRLDAVPTESTPLAAYIPRALAPVTLTYRRAAAIPNDLKWGVEGAGNVVLAGNTIRVRYTFNGTDKLALKKLALRSEGALKDFTTQTSVPFPIFDRKGRAFVDYETAIRPEASTGWRIARGELEAGDGLTALIQASYRVAPVVDLEMDKTPFKTQTRDQRIKVGYILRSNSPRQVRGSVAVTLPTGFHLVSNQGKEFAINNAKGSVRRVLEIDVPANAKGVYPIPIRAEIGGQFFDKTLYLNIE